MVEQVADTPSILVGAHSSLILASLLTIDSLPLLLLVDKLAEKLIHPAPLHLTGGHNRLFGGTCAPKSPLHHLLITVIKGLLRLERRPPGGGRRLEGLHGAPLADSRTRSCPLKERHVRVWLGAHYVRQRLVLRIDLTLLGVVRWLLLLYLRPWHLVAADGL